MESKKMPDLREMVKGWHCGVGRRLSILPGSLMEKEHVGWGEDTETGLGYGRTRPAPHYLGSKAASL